MKKLLLLAVCATTMLGQADKCAERRVRALSLHSGSGVTIQGEIVLGGKAYTNETWGIIPSSPTVILIMDKETSEWKVVKTAPRGSFQRALAKVSSVKWMQKGCDGKDSDVAHLCNFVAKHSDSCYEVKNKYARIWIGDIDKRPAGLNSPEWFFRKSK